MTTIIRHDGPVPELRADVARLRQLAEDLDAIVQGRHPDRAALNDAPLITGWSRALRREPCLVGIVEGHPTIADSCPGMTSGLWVLAPELGYARTLNRLYALGLRAP